MLQGKKNRLDLLYVEAAGDMVKSYRDWSQQIATPEETSITFSSQLFDFAEQNQLSLLALAFGPQVQSLTQGAHQIVTRPRPFTGHGLFYYVSEVLNGLWLVWLVLSRRPRTVIVSSGVCLWLSLLPLALLRVEVLASLHNTPWPVGFAPTSALKRLLLRLDGFFFRHVASAVICVSPACARQVRELGGAGVRIEAHLPQYRPGHLQQPLRPVHDEARPFRIVFAGRVELDKGVLDIVQMATLLRERNLPPCTFDLCGDGSALAAVTAAVQMAGLQQQVILHGRLARAELVQRYAQADLVIVPTTSSFNEGFAMVAAEAVMMGVPVLTSALVPAAEVLADAAVLAQTNDVESYVEKIVLLMTDAAYYQRCQQACSQAVAQFLTPDNGFRAALQRARAG